jgi:hypothetical protein
MDIMLTNVQIVELESIQVTEALGASLMLNILPPLDAVLYSSMMFTSPFTPTSVTGCVNENVLTYCVEFIDEKTVHERLWMINTQGECAEDIDYVCVDINDPLCNGKRGGQVVLIKPSFIDQGGCR